MKRYIPIALAVIVIVGLGIVVVSQKKSVSIEERAPKSFVLGTLYKEKRCTQLPQFLRKLHIKNPLMIDLSQKQFKGIALLHGKNLQKVLHPKQWEQYEHFGTYALNNRGDIFLVPMPYISIHPTTFNLQKNLYKMDSISGKISIFFSFDDIDPSATNPFGLQSIVYDCEDKTLWLSAIDESDYQTQRGVIYHFDPRTKKILQKIEGYDILTLKIVHTDKGKYLLGGSARTEMLYAFEMHNARLETKAYELLKLPNPNMRIRKIKVKNSHTLELQTIPFGYTLIAETGNQDRTYYHAQWNDKIKVWQLNIVSH